MSYKNNNWDNIPENNKWDDNPIQQLELFDFNKSYSENFENHKGSKFILIEVRNEVFMRVFNPEINLPNPTWKCLVNKESVESFDELPEFTIWDYDSIFGIRLTSFIQYTDYLKCDEIVMFEALLIKSYRFGFKPFYWSKEVIKEEIKIRSDRVDGIIKRFKEEGILSNTEVKRIQISGKPRQVTYFTLNYKGIKELLSKIYKKEHLDECLKDIDIYINPGLDAKDRIAKTEERPTYQVNKMSN